MPEVLATRETCERCLERLLVDKLPSSGLRRVILAESDVKSRVARCDCVFEDNSNVVYVVESGGYSTKIGGIQSQVCECIRQAIINGVVDVQEASTRLRAVICLWSRSIPCEELSREDYLLPFLALLHDERVNLRSPRDAMKSLRNRGCSIVADGCCYRLHCGDRRERGLRCSIAFIENFNIRRVSIEVPVCVVVCNVCRDFSHCLSPAQPRRPQESSSRSTMLHE